MWRRGPRPRRIRDARADVVSLVPATMHEWLEACMLGDWALGRLNSYRRHYWIFVALTLATTPLPAHAQSQTGSPTESAAGKTHEETGGLGIDLTAENGLIKVLGPFDNSPGAKAGIRPGDVITHVNGEPVQGLQLNQVVQKIRGLVGTSVRLTIQRAGSDGPTELTLTRDTLAPPDERELARLYRVAADQGIAAGQAGLAAAYATGRGGLPKNEEEAVRLYKLAADQGNAAAQAGLGSFYAAGSGGLSKDEREVVRLYKLAADQ